ncbi:MAG: hypothetical protein K0R90_477 [Oscillospiraceae bacterium]|jgi:hypothetical protein|nr:hypothetical protein [Oscillospiraceae bacterium]
MKESIYTIPVSEVFEPKCGCPICIMRDTLEKRCIEYIMGAAMMEPDVRVETNRLGFCKDHLSMMLKQRNRLSLALMLQTHLDEVKKNALNGKNSLFDKNSKVKKISHINSTCYVCDSIDWALERMLDNIYGLYEKESSFRELFLQQETLCLPHFQLICGLAPQKLQKRSCDEFVKVSTELVTKYINELSGDISHFCKMFDYRNAGEGADWGNSKDSVERASWFLTSYQAK